MIGRIVNNVFLKIRKVNIMAYFKHLMTIHCCFNVRIKPTNASKICEFIINVENLLHVSAFFREVLCE